MRILTAAFCAVLSAALLSACNTSDALTPQVDVGAGLQPSSPVTHADAARLAGTTQQQAGNQSYSAPAGQPQGMLSPHSSLQAQAQAIEAGQTSPASSGPSPGQGGALQPADIPQQPSPSQTAALQPSASGAIRFLPIIGAPVQAVTPLSRQLGAQARAGGLTIRPSSDTATDHILKGYFSAFGDSGTVTVVYVWDILDNEGARLHRMQGQEQIGSTAKDPWAAVPAATMEAIAAKTIRDYLAWKGERAG